MTLFIRRLLALFISFFTCLSPLFGGTSVSPWDVKEETAVVNDISGDGSLSDSVLLASRLKNGVQCVYANARRSAYTMKNLNAVLTHTLGKYRNGATLTNADGKKYISDSFDAWCRDSGGDDRVKRRGCSQNSPFLMNNE